jgi:hypothetical protein
VKDHKGSGNNGYELGVCTATTGLTVLVPSAPLGRGSGVSIVEMGMRRALLGDGVGGGVDG